MRKKVFISPGNEHGFRGCPARCLVATPSDWTFAALRNFDSQTGRCFLSAYLVSHAGTNTDKRWNYSKGNRVEFKYPIYVQGVIWYHALLSFLLVTNLAHSFQCIYLFIYFTSLHVSSNPVLNNRGIELYQYINWYISHCVGEWLVCRSGRNFLTGIPARQIHSVTYTRWCIDTIRFSWWWALGCSKHVVEGNK